MKNTYKLNIKNQDLLNTIQEFLKSLITERIVDSLLIPQVTPSNKSVVQTLVKQEKEIKEPDTFVPFLLMNSARLVAQLTVDEPQKKLGVVLRPCEIRATVELAKLKQANLENVVIIGLDCLGTYEPEIFRQLVKNYKHCKELTQDFLSKNLLSEPQLLKNENVRLACQGCEYPSYENVDISVNFLGCDISKEIFLRFSEKTGANLINKLKLVSANDMSRWEDACDRHRKKRIKFRDKLFQQVLNELKDIKNFLKELEKCRRCYNCRKECPICYCRECIFDSDVFEHSSAQFFNWAQKKGKIRMPVDTLLYHLTRMNHMVVSCVACGQCTSACPNDIEVGKYFKTIGNKVQQIFGYKPGMDLQEELPQSTFKEDEFKEAV